MTGDLGSAVRLVREAGQIRADIPGRIARVSSYMLAEVLIASGDLAAAEHVCEEGLARGRDVGNWWIESSFLMRMAVATQRAGRITDASWYLREALQAAMRIGNWIEVLNGLDCCGYLALRPGAPPRRSRPAPRTLRSPGRADSPIHQRMPTVGTNHCARPGRRSGQPGRPRPRSAARR